MAFPDWKCKGLPWTVFHIIAHIFKDLPAPSPMSKCKGKPRHSILPDETGLGFDPLHNQGNIDNVVTVFPEIVSGDINVTSNFKSAKIWIMFLFYVLSFF